MQTMVRSSVRGPPKQERPRNSRDRAIAVPLSHIWALWGRQDSAAFRAQPDKVKPTTDGRRTRSREVEPRSIRGGDIRREKRRSYGPEISTNGDQPLFDVA